MNNANMTDGQELDKVSFPYQNVMTTGQRYSLREVTVTDGVVSISLDRIVKQENLPIKILRKNGLIFYSVAVSGGLEGKSVSLGQWLPFGGYRHCGSSAPLRCGDNIVVLSKFSSLDITRKGKIVDCIGVYSDKDLPKNFGKGNDTRERYFYGDISNISVLQFIDKQYEI